MTDPSSYEITPAASAIVSIILFGLIHRCQTCQVRDLYCLASVRLIFSDALDSPNVARMSGQLCLRSDHPTRLS